MSIKHAVGPVCAVTAIIALVVSRGQVRTNTDGLKLIGNAEGCLREPYRCPAGGLTDGLGNTHGVKPGTHKADPQIAAGWQSNILDAEHCINTYFRGGGREMPDSTFSAMTSAAFTAGCYGLRTCKGKDGGRHETTLHKLAQQGKWCGMRECLPEFNNGGKYPGLTTCREAERQLCLKGWGSMRWTFPLMIVALLAFLSVAAVFYRIQYQGAEEALR